MDEQSWWEYFFHPRLKTSSYAQNIICAIVALALNVINVYARELQGEHSVSKSSLLVVSSTI